MNSGISSNSSGPANDEKVARIFLKPLARRYWILVRLVDVALRPIAVLFGPRAGGESGSPESVLVFDPGVLGDMMMLAPFLRRLRACLPASHLTLLGRPGAGSFLLERGLVDECIDIAVPWGQRSSRLKRHNPFSLAWLNFCRDAFRLRQRRFDLGFAAGWSADIRGNLAIWLTGARRRVGYGYGGGNFFLTDVVSPDLAHTHVTDRNLHLLEHVGYTLHTDEEVLPVTPEDGRAADQLLIEHGISSEALLIGVHPGAGAAVREWGDQRFAEVAKYVIDQFGAKVVWFSDPVKPRPAPESVDVIPLSLSFRLFVAVVSRCRLFLCNDSGPMHVAAGLGVPVVALFGPTQVEWFGPSGHGHRVVMRHDIWCRPCADNCRWQEPYCLRLISVEQVMEAVTEALKTSVRSYTTAETVTSSKNGMDKG